MKKSILFLLCCTILVTLFSCKHRNDISIKTESNPASDFEYEVNSNQTGILINKYIGKSQDVVIPSHIENLPVLSLKGLADENFPTSIREGAFEGSNIKTVVIPETIKIVGYAAFFDCKELTQVTFSENSNLTYISGSSFSNCVNLEKIDLATTQVKGIESLAFRGCTKLKEITFPNTLEEIRARAFYECSALLEVDFPDSLTKIEGGAFAYCTNLQRVVIPKNLNLISFDESIFHNVSSIKQIVFEDGRESITGYALFQTDASFEMVVPPSVKKFSPLPFLINPSADITITFLGNAPEIVEDKIDWFGNPTIYYDPQTTRWDTFSWKDRFEIKTVYSTDPFFTVEESDGPIPLSQMLSLIADVPTEKYEQYPLLHNIPLSATLYKNGEVISVDITDPRLIGLINLYNNCVYYGQYAYTQGLLNIDYLEKEVLNKDFRLVISFNTNKESTSSKYDTNIQAYGTFVITNKDFTLIDYDSSGYKNEEDRYPFKAVAHNPLFYDYSWLDLFGF